jgi:hypothetical protein
MEKIVRALLNSMNELALIIVSAALEKAAEEGRTVGAASSRDMGG